MRVTYVNQRDMAPLYDIPRGGHPSPIGAVVIWPNTDDDNWSYGRVRTHDTVCDYQLEEKVHVLHGVDVIGLWDRVNHKPRPR